MAAAERSEFKITAAKKLEMVNGPKALKIRDNSAGYIGASQAVGPVFCLNRLVNPLF